MDVVDAGGVDGVDPGSRMRVLSVKVKPDSLEAVYALAERARVVFGWRRPDVVRAVLARGMGVVTAEVEAAEARAEAVPEPPAV